MDMIFVCVKMNNNILGFFVDDLIDLNVVEQAAINLAIPLPLLAIEERETHARNKDYYERVVPQYTGIRFEEHFRMSRESAESLVHILGNRILNPDRLAVLRKKLLFTIWVLSKQESFLATSDRFNLAVSTGHTIFREIIDAITSLLPQYIIWPEENAYEITTAIFFEKSRGFPGIIGAIDGCHIPCKQPVANEVDYYNRKGFHSIILQGTCDHKGKFIDVYIGSPGRIHDSRVFRNSPLFQKITEENLIPSSYHLLGDAAYPLKINILTPFRDTGHLTPSQTIYNTKLSSVRSTIERAFGQLKGKFRRLKYLDISDFALGNNMIAAACVLHNFIIDQKEDFEDANDYENPEINFGVQNEGEEAAAILEMAAVEKRNRIMRML